MAPHASSAAPLRAVPTVAVTIPAGGSASIEVQGLALQPGSQVAQVALTLGQQPLASDRLRTTLFYGIDWGYALSDPQQVALALWWAQDGTWRSTDRAIGERIANAAANSPGVPSWNPDGRSVLSLVATGQVSLSELRLSPTGATAASGTGTLTVRNRSSQELTVHLPYGTLFGAGTGAAIVWAVSGSAGEPEPPAEPTAPAEEPMATATAVMEPSATPNGSYKPGYTPEATPTEEPAVEPTTPAEEPQPTAAPTEAPVQAPVLPVEQPADTAPKVEAEAEAPVDSTPKGPQPAAPAPPSSVQKDAPAPSAPGPVSEPGGRQEDPEKEKAGVDVPGSGQADAPASDAAQAPPPVSTIPGQSQPPPVMTGQAQITPPNPELTRLATLPALSTRTPSRTPTTEVKSTETTAASDEPTIIMPPGAGTDPTKPPEPTKAQPGGTGTGAIDTPVPTPLPVVPTPNSPVIITGGDDTSGANSQTQTLNTSGSASGSPPNSAPATGGGPSSLPAWLALFSAMMMVGGWSLRRVSVPAVPVAADEGSRGDGAPL